MLTPSTPTRAISNSASVAHKADANVWATPGADPHETVFISSIRRVRPRECTSLVYGARVSARPVEAVGASRGAIVGNGGSDGEMKHFWRGYRCSVTIVIRGSATRKERRLGSQWGNPIAGPASGS